MRNDLQIISPQGAHPQQQKGVLLIIVLLVVALVSVLATQTFSRISLDQRRSANIQQTSQAYYFALGAEELALQILQRTLDGKDDVPTSASANNQNTSNSKGNNKGEKSGGAKTINLSQPWAQKGMVFPIDGGQLAGSIKDMSACFNINALLDVPPTTGGSVNLSIDPNKPLILQPMMEQLFTEVLKDLETEVDPKALVSALRDWLDQDQEPQGSYGAEDGVYQSKTPSYLTGNTLVGSVEELRTIEGFNAEIVEKLKPYLCALPDTQMKSLNINTLTEEQSDLVVMLFEKKDENKARDLINNRPNNGYDVDGLAKALDGMKEQDYAKGLLVVTSDRFMINAEAIVGRGHSRLQSLVKTGKEGKLEVVSRRFANDFEQNQSNTNPSTNDVKKAP